MSQFQQNFITSVIERYGLELDDRHVDTITVTWFQKYESSWIVKAIVESLYRGRYKIKSVDNILRDWERLGKPRYDFTPEYERGILQNLPAINDLPATPIPPIVAAPISPPDLDISVIQAAVVRDSKNLNPEESAPFRHHSHSTLVDRSIDTEALNLDDRSSDNSSESMAPLYPETLEESGSANDKDSSNVALVGVASPLENRIASPPVKFHLFNTLKAIVDPNNHQKAEVDNPECPPLNPQITKFKLPHENING